MKKTALVIALCFWSASAEATEPKTVREKDQVAHKKKTVIDFSDLTITGEVTHPTASMIYSRGTARFRSLIRLRKSFLPELERSADEM